MWGGGQPARAAPLARRAHSRAAQLLNPPPLFPLQANLWRQRLQHQLPRGEAHARRQDLPDLRGHQPDPAPHRVPRHPGGQQHLHAIEGDRAADSAAQCGRTDMVALALPPLFKNFSFFSCPSPPLKMFLKVAALSLVGAQAAGPQWGQNGGGRLRAGVFPASSLSGNVSVHPGPPYLVATLASAAPRARTPCCTRPYSAALLKCSDYAYALAPLRRPTTHPSCTTPHNSACCASACCPGRRWARRAQPP